MKQSFTAQNSLESILALIPEAASFVKENGGSPRALFITELVLEEILTNTVKYGKLDKSLNSIAVAVNVENGQVGMEIRDNGRSFDPLKAPPPSFGEPVKTQRLGGRGIHLVKAFVSEINYRHENDCNILTLGFPAQAA